MVPVIRRSVSAVALGVLGLTLAIVSLTACSKSKVNADNYAKINNGMTQAEVEAILGPGTQQASTSVAMPAVPAMPTAAPGAAVDPAAMMAAAAPAKTDAKTIVWQDGQKAITITLINDKVFSKTGVGL